MNKDLIKQALKEGLPITEAETAFLLRNDINAMLAFMVENNLGSVNVALRNGLGYDKLTFNPDKEAIVRQLNILVERKNSEELQTVIKNFTIDPSKITPTLLIEIKKQFQNG
jgi:hypothetical protein